MSRRWSADDIPDLRGRRAVVTGANSGIGFHAALELARHGAEVVLACRDLDRGREALGRIGAEVAGARVSVGELDLADLGSVRAFADAQAGRLDLLINNAGVMAIPRRETADGFEMQLGTNHLGHFALTGLLLGALTEAPAPRVVTVSSGAHRMGRIDFDDLQSERGYRRWGAYGQSKLANLLFCFELQRRADAADVALRSMAAHPGYAATNLQLAGPRMRSNPLESLVARAGNLMLGQSAAAGALPTLFAATEPDLPGGTYAGPGGPAEWRGAPRIVGCSSAARDPDTARRLWDVSEQLTGVRYSDWPASQF